METDFDTVGKEYVSPLIRRDADKFEGYTNYVNTVSSRMNLTGYNELMQDLLDAGEVKLDPSPPSSGSPGSEEPVFIPEGFPASMAKLCPEMAPRKTARVHRKA